MDLLIKAINDLSLSFYKHLAEGEDNVFFSPFSISAVLSMLLPAARRKTEQEMREILHFERVNIPNSEVHHCFDQLFSALSRVSDHVTLTSANAILSQKDMSILPEFKRTVERTYRPVLMEVDFVRKSGKAVRQINDWVKKNTSRMIPRITDSLEPSTLMVLLNAIYFKGSWRDPFDHKLTRRKDFYNKGQRSQLKKVPMMFQNERFLFVEKGTYKALELPYEIDTIVMLILLPNEVDGLPHLEKMLTVDLLKDILSSLSYCEVQVTLPKLNIECSMRLSETSVKLGMVSAFQRLSNSNSDDVSCDSFNVPVKSLFVASEDDSVSITKTEECEGPRSEAKPMKKVFEANHPFLCIVYDKENDLVLFIGRVIEFLNGMIKKNRAGWYFIPCIR